MYDNVSCTLQIGFTALHWAIEFVYHSVIEVLLQYGASLTIKNKVRTHPGIYVTWFWKTNQIVAIGI